VRSIGPALLLLLAGIVVVVVAFFLWGAMAVSTTHSGGCNNIPIVNGQPAYNCKSNLPHN